MPKWCIRPSREAPRETFGEMETLKKCLLMVGGLDPVGRNDSRTDWGSLREKRFWEDEEKAPEKTAGGKNVHPGERSSNFKNH